MKKKLKLIPDDIALVKPWKDSPIGQLFYLEPVYEPGFSKRQEAEDLKNEIGLMMMSIMYDCLQ